EHCRASHAMMPLHIAVCHQPRLRDERHHPQRRRDAVRCVYRAPATHGSEERLPETVDDRDEGGEEVPVRVTVQRVAGRCCVYGCGQRVLEEVQMCESIARVATYSKGVP